MLALQNQQLSLEAGRPAGPESYSLARDELEKRGYRLIGGGKIMRHQRDRADGIAECIGDRELVLLALGLLEALGGQRSALGDPALQQQDARQHRLRKNTLVQQKPHLVRAAVQSVSRMVQGQRQLASCILLHSKEMGGGADQAMADRLVGGAPGAQRDLEIAFADLLGRGILTGVEVIAPQRPDRPELKLEVGQFLGERETDAQCRLHAVCCSRRVEKRETQRDIELRLELRNAGEPGTEMRKSVLDPRRAFHEGQQLHPHRNEAGRQLDAKRGIATGRERPVERCMHVADLLGETGDVLGSGRGIAEWRYDLPEKAGLPPGSLFDAACVRELLQRISAGALQKTPSPLE